MARVGVSLIIFSTKSEKDTSLRTHAVIIIVHGMRTCKSGRVIVVLCDMHKILSKAFHGFSLLLQACVQEGHVNPVQFIINHYLAL
jgi:hypothetical protein